MPQDMPQDILQEILQEYLLEHQHRQPTLLCAQFLSVENLRICYAARRCGGGVGSVNLRIRLLHYAVLGLLLRRLVLHHVALLLSSKLHYHVYMGVVAYMVFSQLLVLMLVTLVVVILTLLGGTNTDDEDGEQGNVQEDSRNNTRRHPIRRARQRSPLANISS